MVLQERSFDGAGPPFMPGTLGTCSESCRAGGKGGFRTGPDAAINWNYLITAKVSSCVSFPEDVVVSNVSPVRSRAFSSLQTYPETKGSQLGLGQRFAPCSWRQSRPQRWCNPEWAGEAVRQDQLSDRSGFR
jgi:hypothetical protein